METGVDPKVDVILGQGAVARKYSGTYDYRKLVNEMEQAYAFENKKVKNYIPQTIVAIIASLGGRYLQRTINKNNYEVIGNEAAVEKTTQALRDARSRKKRETLSSVTTSFVCVTLLILPDLIRREIHDTSDVVML